MNIFKDRKRQARRTEHLHYVITCGECGEEFGSCGIPCFVYCPFCRVRLILWTEGR